MGQLEWQPHPQRQRHLIRFHGQAHGAHIAARLRTAHLPHRNLQGRTGPPLRQPLRRSRLCPHPHRRHAIHEEGDLPKPRHPTSQTAPHHCRPIRQRHQPIFLGPPALQRPPPNIAEVSCSPRCPVNKRITVAHFVDTVSVHSDRGRIMQHCSVVTYRLVGPFQNSAHNAMGAGPPRMLGPNIRELHIPPQAKDIYRESMYPSNYNIWLIFVCR